MGRVLEGVNVAILADDMVDEAELVEPRRRLEAAGAKTFLISQKPGKIISTNFFNKSHAYKVDGTFEEVTSDDFDAVYLPGGTISVDHLRANPWAQDFVAQMDKDGKPIAVMCRGSWLLVSAGLVRDRTLTSFYTIRDDIENAGGEWSDEAVVLDGNWISSRRASDIPNFIRSMISVFRSVTRVPR